MDSSAKYETQAHGGTGRAWRTTIGRPADRLSARTVERLDAACALGARETWIDRTELRLPEPSGLGRWLCVLEWPGFPLQASGSSAPVDRTDAPEYAARAALARFADVLVLAETPPAPVGHSSVAHSPDAVPADVAALRAHVAELCVTHGLRPVCPESSAALARAGSLVVPLPVVTDTGDYWRCLATIGLALADPADSSEVRARRVWEWVRGNALPIALPALPAEVEWRRNRSGIADADWLCEAEPAREAGDTAETAFDADREEPHSDSPRPRLVA